MHSFTHAVDERGVTPDITVTLFRFVQNSSRVSQQGAEACGAAGYSWNPAEYPSAILSDTHLVMHYVSLRATSGVSTVQLTHWRCHSIRGSHGYYS